MNWRSPRFLMVLLALFTVLVVAIGAEIWIYLAHQSNQSQNSSNNRWVHLPPVKPGEPTPTTPARGYLFTDGLGGFVVYNLPSTTPVTITWTTYRNQQDGYTIDYPSSWIQVKSTSKGHDWLVFYPPGTDSNANVPGGPKGTGLGWTETQMPIPTDPTVAGIKPITVNGV